MVVTTACLRKLDCPRRGYENRNMQYTTLGDTGLLVSRLSLCVMTFGNAQGIFKAVAGVDQKAADELVKAAIERICARP